MEEKINNIKEQLAKENNYLNWEAYINDQPNWMVEKIMDKVCFRLLSPPSVEGETGDIEKKAKEYVKSACELKYLSDPVTTTGHHISVLISLFAKSLQSNSGETTVSDSQCRERDERIRELEKSLEEMIFATESMMHHNKVQEGLLENERKLRAEAESNVERYEKALDEVMTMRVSGNSDYKYALNRCWHVADRALSSNKQG